MLDLNRILLPTDFSDAASDAERRARALARLFQAELHVLHVTRSNELSLLSDCVFRKESAASDRRKAHMLGWLRTADEWPAGRADPTLAADAAAPSPPRVVRAIRRASSPDDGILEYADEMETDLIVIGTQGSGSTRGPLLGSVADRIIRKASLPVVTVRPDVATDDPSAEVIRDDTRQRLLVVPVDVAEPSEPTASLLAKAKHWAATFDAAVDVLHVVGEPRVPSMYQWDAFRNRMPSLVADVQEQLRDAVDAADGPAVDVATRVLVGRAAEEIVAYASAQHANMLLMATGGPSGLRTYVLGGVTDQVLRTAPCPVCAFKSQDASLIPASNPAASAPDALPSAPATVADAGAQTR